MAAHRPDLTETGEDTLDESERRAIASLQRLARTWPRSLMLASMAGTLVIVRTDDERFDDDDNAIRNQAAVAFVHGIPNTGGDW